MPRKIVHMCIDIRGVLNWKNRDLTNLFSGTPEQIREFLYDKLSEGYDVLPFGEPCEGFDKKTGCPGHSESIKKPF